MGLLTTQVCAPVHATRRAATRKRFSTRQGAGTIGGSAGDANGPRPDSEAGPRARVAGGGREPKIAELIFGRKVARIS